MNEAKTIVVAANEDFIAPLKTMLTSLFRWNDNCEIHFLETSPISEKSNEDLRKICRQGGGTLKIWKFNRQLPENVRFSEATFARLFIAYIVPSQIKKVLYLDADILVMDDLSELFEMKMNDKMILGVPDRYSDNLKEDLKLSEQQKYINAGVLLINLEKWREKFSEQEFYSKLMTFRPVTPYIDQEFINDVFRDEIGYLDKRYNSTAFWNSIYPWPGRKPYIVHFLGDFKPWDDKYRHQYFIKYRKTWNAANPEKKLSLRKYLFRVGKRGVCRWFSNV